MRLLDEDGSESGGGATRERVGQNPSESAPVLPIQLLWIALLAALLLGSGPSALWGEQTWGYAVRGTAALCLPYLVITATLIAFYRYVAPRCLSRIGTRPLRIAFYVISTAVVAAIIGIVLFSPYRALDPEPLSFSDWLIACVVNAWALTLPTLWVSHLSAEIERKRRSLVEAELAALHAQINPHFLFNSLNTVASLIAERPRDAEMIVERLSEVLRHVLGTSPGQLVPLRRELDFAKNLLSIHEIRFEGSLTVDMRVDPSVEDSRVPSLLLQPLLENAILHGVASRGHGHIVVAAYPLSGRWVVEVVDDGVGVGASSHRGHGTGLAHLEQRLVLLYGGEATLQLEASGTGTRAIVRLPRSAGEPG